MPAVFVHGVPDTPCLWRDLVQSLARKDVVALALPGFASPLPERFDCSKEAYAAWLITELERVGAPVDLVAHDWGAKLMQRVVSLRPDLIRTWAGGGGIVDREYVWHDIARQWQTPTLGEEIIDTMMTPEHGVPMLVATGVPSEIAGKVLACVDERMKQSILGLYRSAMNIGAEWHADVDTIARPGLVIWGRDDAFVPVRFGERLASRVGAELVVFDQCGHWWPTQRPRDAARALEQFWSHTTS